MNRRSLSPLLGALLLCWGCPTQAPPPAAPDLPAAPAPAPADPAAPDVAAPDVAAPEPAPPAQPASAPRAPVPGMISSPARYHRVVPRLGYPVKERYGDMCYEGNNLAMRGQPDLRELLPASGEEVARRWREAAEGVGCLFVLRDSLFSQPDHPWQHESYAPMLPPAWVTLAVDHVRRGRKLEPMHTWHHSNEVAWTAAKEPAQIFGSFPPSQTLFALATQALADTPERERPRVLHARHTLHALASDVSSMMTYIGHGPEAVALEGAQRISRGDRRYFTDALRRERVVPILVENPDAKERDEGKGLLPQGVEVEPESARLARRAILRQRLKDGDVAIERYDISRPEERQRAIALLEELIPRDDLEPTTVWLWVTGPLEEGAKLQGEDATTWIGALRLELEEANVNPARLQILSKPSVPLPTGHGATEAFDEALTRFEALDLPMSVQLQTEALRRLILDTERLREER